MLIWTHTSLTNLTGKIDFDYRIFEKDEGIALIFFIPKYTIKAASGRFYVCIGVSHLKKAILEAIGCVV